MGRPFVSAFWAGIAIALIALLVLAILGFWVFPALSSPSGSPVQIPTTYGPPPIAMMGG